MIRIMMLRRCAIAVWTLALLSFAQSPGAASSIVQLRIEAMDVKDGVPERIKFVFTNTGREPIRLPTIAQCIRNGYFGRVKLTLKFTPPVPPQKSMVPGGCGGGTGGSLALLDQAVRWNALAPWGSFAVTYSRSELFVAEQEPGIYELWGEYDPPELTAQERNTLERAQINFENVSLISNHLRLVRRK